MMEDVELGQAEREEELRDETTPLPVLRASSVQEEHEVVQPRAVDRSKGRRRKRKRRLLPSRKLAVVVRLEREKLCKVIACSMCIALLCTFWWRHNNLGERERSHTVSGVLVLSFLVSVATSVVMLAVFGWVRPNVAYALLHRSSVGVAGDTENNGTSGIWLPDIVPGRRNSELTFLGETVEQKVDCVVETIEDGGALFEEVVEVVECTFLSFDEAEELNRFKAMLDTALRNRGSSMYSLVFEIVPISSQSLLIEHIRQVWQRDGVPSPSSGKKFAPQRVCVISDMDDTLVSTFKDRRFPFNTLYPGVRQFYHELIRSGGVPESWTDWDRVKDQVSFVTARPNFLNPWTRSHMKRHGFATSVALTGTSTSFITPSQMLGRKIKQCTQMQALFPECIFFLVGDNGQKDIDLGKELLRLKLVRAVFIHDIFEPLSHGKPEIVGRQSSTPLGTEVDEIQPSVAASSILKRSLSSGDADSFLKNDEDRGETESRERLLGSEHKPDSESILPKFDEEVRVIPSVPEGYRQDECLEHGIILFQSYTGAALDAMKRNLFTTQALLNVAISSAEDFSNISFRRPTQRIKQREVYLKDIARVSHTLGEDLDQIRFLKRIHELVSVDPAK